MLPRKRGKAAERDANFGLGIAWAKNDRQERKGAAKNDIGRNEFSLSRRQGEEGSAVIAEGRKNETLLSVAYQGEI